MNNDDWIKLDDDHLPPCKPNDVYSEHVLLCIYFVDHDIYYITTGVYDYKFNQWLTDAVDYEEVQYLYYMPLPDYPKELDKSKC